jgi:hypothetical protein
LSLDGEIQLLEIAKSYDLNCLHRLEQRKITDFIHEAKPSDKKICEQLLRKNRMLPRNHLTKQVDLVCWKNNHWAALAVEEKQTEGARKVLEISKDEVVLKVLYEGGMKRFDESGRQLYFQCRGEELLTQVYFSSRGVKSKAIPVGVVDYDIVVNSKIKSNWAYYRGVFFVNREYFPQFLEDYKNDCKWIRNIVHENPKIAFRQS